MDETSPHRYFDHHQLQVLIDVLQGNGYDVIGPTIEEGAIVYDRIRTISQLPRGWTDQQSPGHYRLVPRSDDALFGYVVGPHSWKKFLFPPEITVARTRREGTSIRFEDVPITPEKFAFLGVRSCELAAIGIQDRVFMTPEFTDPIYASRRKNLTIISVQCSQAAATCFCSSMKTGPKANRGFDLALTELPGGFFVEIGSDWGQTLVDQLACSAPTPEHEELARLAWKSAEQQITRQVSAELVPLKLKANLEHPRWEAVAERCLSCANCTMVCPTCFCSSVDEVNDLLDEEILRNRRWDSCFNTDFSHVNGGPVRNQIRSRYRQWLTHKLSTWFDQFGTSGCVGCGRCITWCPVGIDLTQEVAAICEEDP